MTGANDAPTVTASNGAITEMAGTGNAALDHAGGSISFADLDLSDRPIVSTSFSGYTYKAANGITDLSLTAQQQDGLGVALTLTPAGGNTNNGSVNWSYDVADNQFDFLADGETLTLTYTATVNDHHGGIVTSRSLSPSPAAMTRRHSLRRLAGKLTDTAANDSFANLHGDAGWKRCRSRRDRHAELRRARRISAVNHRGRRPLRLADGERRRYLHLRSQRRRDQCAARRAATPTPSRCRPPMSTMPSASAILTVDVKGANDTPSIVGEVNPPAQIIVVAAPTSPHVLAAGVNVNSLGLNTETFDGLTAGSSSNNGAGHGNFQSAALGAISRRPAMPESSMAPLPRSRRPRLSGRDPDTRTPPTI